jgi:tetratricopeptide (TPR) repeat protein
MVRTKLDSELQAQLDNKMQEGYELSMACKTKEAVDVWKDLWNRIKDAMNGQQIKYIEDMDEASHGQQSIFNWVMDFELELTKAAERDKAYNYSKIDFCADYIEMSRDKNEFNKLVLKQEIAVAHFELGKIDEGEELFKRYLDEHPASGWGWIKWSDQYGVFADEQIKDEKRAIQILKQALEVKGLEDKMDVMDRLEELYNRLEMTQESMALKQKIIEMQKPSNHYVQEREKTITSSRNAPQIKVTKVGRNRPCPCGSGKRFKKCCG